MNSGRWNKMETLIEQALLLPAEQRAAFLDKKCSTDDRLRKEIESLLALDQSADTFLENIKTTIIPSTITDLFNEMEQTSGTDELDMTGQKFAHYQIIDKIGVGGMAVVYKARDTILDRIVALKFLLHFSSHQHHQNKKILREAKAAASLNHPNIATIYEINEADEHFFIAMEFVDGKTIREIIESGPLDAETALPFAVQIAEALSEAHEQGVIHQDIKPENIMAGPKNRIKVMDFGIATLTDSVDHNNTQSTAGTPEYMSPEQIEGVQIDHRTDLWSFGVLLYEMLTGDRPFKAGSSVEVFSKVLHQKPDLLQNRIDAIPKELSSLVDRMLQKNPDDRPANASDVLNTCQKLMKKKTIIHKKKSFHVPKPLTVFIGRKQELDELTNLLFSSRLLTLTGVAGSGKTRLAIELAHKLRNAAANGIYFIDLSSIRTSDLVLPAISRMLNIKTGSDKSDQEVIKKYLKTRNLILILDNFEQVIDAAPIIADFVVYSPNCKFVVTSREPLNIQGEKIFPVPPLLLPRLDDNNELQVLSRIEAIALFLERAKEARPGFSLTEDNKMQIMKICEQLDGLPLAIELAAVRIKTLSLKELLLRLNNRFKLLSSGTKDLPERQQSLRMAIEWSYDLLPKKDKILFMRLAVFSGGFSLQAAESICHSGFETDYELLESISSLVSKNLIYRIDNSEESSRFNMLVSIREFAADKLLQSGEFVILRDKHRKYYARICEKLHTEISESIKTEFIQKVDLDYDNFIRALDWKSGITGESKNSLILGNVLWRYWLRKCLFFEGRNRIRELLKSVDTSKHKELVAEMYLGAGTLAHNNGDYKDSLVKINNSLEYYRYADDKKGIATALTNLGWVEWRLGNYEKSGNVTKESLDLQQELNNDSGIAYAYNNLGWIALHQGEFEKAQKHHKKSLNLRKTIGDKRNIAFSLANCAWTYSKMGHFNVAAKHYDEALQIFDEVKDRQLYTFTTCLKAEMMADRLLLEDAKKLITENVLPAFEEIEDSYGTGFAMNTLGIILFRQNKYSESLKNFKSSLQVRRNLGDLWGEAQATCNTGRASMHSGIKNGVLNCLYKSYSIRNTLQDKNGLAESLEAFAEYYYLYESKVASSELIKISAELRKHIHSYRPAEHQTIFMNVVKCEPFLSLDFDMSRNKGDTKNLKISSLLQAAEELIRISHIK